MRRGFLAIVMVLILTACNNKREQNVPVFTYDQPIEEELRVDTVVPVDKPIETKKNESLRNNSNSASIHNGKQTKYDNMRGFDPASEDDLDDNGMSRYMENNDEEGWD